ncbi:hypothetical protein Ljor_2070 [Legionella jordanis]|uniref:Uncharacterized protein n=2 Tax=Legionella jordanis TaxID=456 RepID=A0A0W0VCA8_9GAMM|nr:hypothetical protein Ljor_2070 [Legionella jordanis]VEH11300.1 Uncharacterised protein [Legionella jordanis]
MHFVNLIKDEQNHSTPDCSICIDAETKAELIHRLQLTLINPASPDLSSLAHFCLGVFHIHSAGDESAFMRGLESLKQAMLHNNKHAAYCLAIIHAGYHQDKLSQALHDQEKAIQYYLISYKLDYYEALQDLMLGLKEGAGVIAKDDARWRNCFIQLFIEAGQHKDLRLIPHLIRCLIQQNYRASSNEPFLLHAISIISHWMKTGFWSESHTRLLKDYLQQERKKGHFGSIYLSYKLGFFQPQGVLFFNSDEIQSQNEVELIHSLEQLQGKQGNK